MSLSYVGVTVRKTHSLMAIADFYMNAQSEAVGTAPEEIIDFSYRHYPVVPRQVRSELLQFARIVRTLRPEVIVEIGTHAGGTFFVLCRCAHPEATVISIDLPGGQFSGGRPKFTDPLLRRMPLSTQTFARIQGDSHDGQSVRWLTTLLAGRSIDLLFIDGDHTYDGVKRDFELYSPLVRPAGLIGFHDIVEHPNDPDCQVAAFWREIMQRYRHQELIEDVKQGWAGIGVLHW